MINRERTACFTGHRNISRDESTQIQRKLDITIAKLIDDGVIYYGVGGARGFDTMAANAVLKAAKTNPAVKLIMILPCRDQESKWSEKDKKEYRRLLNAADKVVCLSERYYDGCMEKRNLHLVQHSSVCVAYMKHTRSGTAQTLRFAREYGLRIINLAEI